MNQAPLQFEREGYPGGVLALVEAEGGYVPGLARLFMEKHGERFPGFFYASDNDENEG